MNSTEASATLTVGGAQKPSTAVIELLARVEGADPVELDPLYGAIDPDALDALCDAGSGFESIEFTYHGYLVGITSLGTDLEVTVEQPPTSFEAAAETGAADTESSL